MYLVTIDRVRGLPSRFAQDIEFEQDGRIGITLGGYRGSRKRDYNLTSQYVSTFSMERSPSLNLIKEQKPQKPPNHHFEFQ